MTRDSTNPRTARTTRCPEPRKKRPVGRPTRAPERREQILAAVEHCIIEHGLAATTLARIADTAEVPRSLIHHYLGNRGALLQAAAERAIANVEQAIQAALHAEPDQHHGTDEVTRSLDVLFGPHMQAPGITHLIDELGVAALRDPAVRVLMSRMYAGFVQHVEDVLTQGFPAAAPEQRRAVAHAIVGLADAASRFADYGLDPDNFHRMRTAARTLVEGLRSRSTGK